MLIYDNLREFMPFVIILILLKNLPQLLLINSKNPVDVINKAQNCAMINIRPKNNKTISLSHFPKVTFCLPYLGETSTRSFSRIIRNAIVFDNINCYIRTKGCVAMVALIISVKCTAIKERF